MTGVVVGIDPGLSGGLCLMTCDGDPCCVAVMPTLKVGNRAEIDAKALCLTLKGWDGWKSIRLVAVERVHAMPKQGVTSCFNFGMGYGVVLGVCAALELPLELPTPQAWQKSIFAGMPPAVGPRATKTLSVAYCTRRFPGLSLRATSRSRKAHDGIADAVCLAEYARRLAHVPANGKAV